MTELKDRLEEIARAPVLLVASDYDGTLAPIVPDPADARPLRETQVALSALAGLANTHVAVISGRALRDLADLSGFGDGIRLIGSHGSEFDLDFSQVLSEDLVQLRDRLVDELGAIAKRHEGLHIEIKPASVAFHYRRAPEDVGREALAAVEEGPAKIADVQTRHGKKVIELSVLATSKGFAIEILRQRIGASCVIFFGDDLTDEDAFATLKGPDIGVKVGEGETLAAYRVDETTDVAVLLAQLCELRSEWLTSAGSVPIEEHSLISDQRTSALVTPDARINWLCLPALDSPAIFAELVGGPSAGFFAVRAADGSRPTGQSYRPGSMVLETRFEGFRVTDFFDCSQGRPRQRAGRSDLIRILEGRGPVEIEFAPRLEFGRMATSLEVHEHGLVIRNSHDPIVLRSPGVVWTVEDHGMHQTAVAHVELDGGAVVLDLRYGVGSLRDTVALGHERRDLTSAYWADWAGTLDLPDVATELIERSALVLRALCYSPSGAIAAAATTSLPEHIGGVRNWDYRYCWLRDAALSASALVKLGSISEAMHYLDWVLGVLDNTSSPANLRPLYKLSGASVDSEAEIGELCGYRGSRPVRVGNLAANQVQLDVFGPIVELIHDLLVREAPLSSEHWRLVEAMVSAVAARWDEPDHGIWEVRTAQRHHVHSKVMCWLTVDRAIAIARVFHEKERPDWIALRDAIRADVLEKGWSEERQAFTGAYGAPELDAAALWIGISGLVDPRDPRFVATVEAIERELRVGPTVFRYRIEDGLPGIEGGFHVCASWLIDSYWLVGREDDARALFEALSNLAGPTGLYAEQYGPDGGISLGNHPQAYSHLGLIENALRLASGRATRTGARGDGSATGAKSSSS